MVRFKMGWFSSHVIDKQFQSIVSQTKQFPDPSSLELLPPSPPPNKKRGKAKGKGTRRKASSSASAGPSSRAKAAGAAKRASKTKPKPTTNEEQRVRWSSRLVQVSTRSSRSASRGAAPTATASAGPSTAANGTTSASSGVDGNRPPPSPGRIARMMPGWGFKAHGPQKDRMFAAITPHEMCHRCKSNSVPCVIPTLEAAPGVGQYWRGRCTECAKIGRHCNMETVKTWSYHFDDMPEVEGDDEDGDEDGERGDEEGGADDAEDAEDAEDIVIVDDSEADDDYIDWDASDDFGDEEEEEEEDELDDDEEYYE